jgi:hypothetical protein
MDRKLLARQRSEERLQRKICERIDEVIVPGHADLDQAQLLKVTVQAVRLGIDGDAIVRGELGEHRGQRIRSLDHRMAHPRRPESSNSAFDLVDLRA